MTHAEPEGGLKPRRSGRSTPSSSPLTLCWRRRGPCLFFLRRSYNLFENEDGSDVILMVGDEGYRERVPAHSWVLAAGNQYFRAMFQGPLADRHKKTYDIPNDPKGFQNLLKWLYRHECGIQSIDSALITLQVAIQYLCPELAELCVEYIGKHLTVGNVLKVLQYTWRYCPSQQCSDQSQANLDPSTAPSAPSLEALEGNSRPETNSYGANDPKPHSTSTTPSTLILKRSTLNVPNELKVFQALQRWSTAECKRRMLPLTPDNRRAVLGNLLYHVRFLCMNNEQLQQTTSLLTADEFNYLAARISGHNPVKVPPTLSPYLVTMSSPRCHKPMGLLQSGSSSTDGKSKKKNSSGKKKYTKKELVLDVVSCLAVLFD
ncbi:putative bpb/poz domain containing protein [Penaeus vannamei]|uniref:Putative bpb/poz domain containing protein n=1 Tax=Penaeus vannamei TaxID=6689 RepID=A0A3R7MDP2_PENVA|nr:putative bpb/poz domain containing protein [Penaeus vannamei]